MEEPLSLAKSIVKELKKGHPINIRPLITVLNKDRFVQSKNFKAWMDHYLPFNDWSPQERRDLLMISIGEQAASLFDLASKKIPHQDPFEDAYNTLKDQFCLPQPQFLARIEFYNTKPKVGMKILCFLRKLTLQIHTVKGQWKGIEKPALWVKGQFYDCTTANHFRW